MILKYIGVMCMAWLAQSPDLKPIEHLYVEISVNRFQKFLQLNFIQNNANCQHFFNNVMKKFFATAISTNYLFSSRIVN